MAVQAPEASASLGQSASLANANGSRRTRPVSLARAWSWLHSKYTLSATKRLRVSETVSLGEKRFVALVCVEGREFLIGGGAAGVSLLSALGSAPGGANSRQSESSDAEVSE